MLRRSEQYIYNRRRSFEKSVRSISDKQNNPMKDNRHEVLIRKNAKFVGTGHNSEIVQDEKDKTGCYITPFR